MNTINIQEKFSLFSEFWSPKIVGELNGQYVKLVKLKGEFVWHKHDHEDEMFLVIKGVLKIEYRDRTETIHENEFIVVPKGIEHKPVADEEVWVMLFEPKETLNTGDVKSTFTKENLENILKIVLNPKA